MKRVLLSWSSGKDSAWALHLLRQHGGCEIVGLLTTLNSEFDRVAMHGTRRSILEAQSEAVHIPLWIVPLPWPCSNQAYQQRMSEVCKRAIAEQVDALVFGDLFLADIRAYRESQLKNTGLEALFPVWGLPTDSLAREMIDAGLRARIVSVDTTQLHSSFAGREYDHQFLEDLPPGIDPCGERGEFHTCVYAGPMFSVALSVQSGEVIDRDGFAFADLSLIASPVCRNG